MADLTIHGNPLQQDVPYKLHDNGDGTYSLTTSSSGGGGAVTVADGADVAQGTTTDLTTATTVVGYLNRLNSGLKAEDAASVSGDLLHPIAAVRQDTLSSLVNTDGDYALPKLDSLGRLYQTTGPALEVPFTTTTVQAVATTDVTQYAWASVHIVTQGGSSTIGFQGSNDNTNWVAVPLTLVTNTQSASANSTTSAAVIYAGPLQFRYFRLNVTGIASGTTAGVIEFFPVFRDHVTLTTPFTAADANSGAITFNQSSLTHVYNGSTWDRQRIPAIFKTVTATASGDTALWTPAAGKKFRLQRYSIQITNDAATAGGADIDIILRDATTATAAAFTAFVPAVAATTLGAGAESGWVDFGNGILSATINNVLNINLSAALTAGKVRVVACGTEE